MKDEGCAKDTVKARSAEGVEQRKKIDELIRYGCVDTLPDKLIFYATTGAPDLLIGSPPVRLVKVFLILDVNLVELAGGKLTEADLQRSDFQGYLFKSDIRWISKEEMTRIIQDTKTAPR